MEGGIQKVHGKCDDGDDGDGPIIRGPVSASRSLRQPFAFAPRPPSLSLPSFSLLILNFIFPYILIS